MSSHSASKHEDKTKEQLLELVTVLEDKVDDLEIEIANLDTSISAYDNSDIRDEFHARGLGVDHEEVMAMYEAFYLGKQDQAVEIAKRIACAETGRCL